MSELHNHQLQLISRSTADAISTSEYTLGPVPATLWAPEHAQPGTPLVLIGHGGGRQDRHHPSVMGRARLLNAVGFRAVSIDVDGHGSRPRSTADEQEVEALHAARREGTPIGTIVERYNADLARRTVPEWRALLAALLADPETSTAQVGYWGITLGTAIGVPLVAQEPAIKAAVFGLFWPSTLLAFARQITVPVEFAMQWDDEHITRAESLALFDAFASNEKSLHVNAGRHMDMPRFEAASTVRFFQRHLTD
ncbi:MAG: dienelactone hydrolase family protein [Candidatus Nanopelagicales bacterium]